MATDIRLTEEGDITIPTQAVLGEDLIIQKVRGRSETFLGEWLLDSRQGVPWQQWLEEIDVPLEQIEDFLKLEYEGIAGVRRADVVAALESTTIVLSAVIYLDQGDAPALQLTASIPADEPAVIHVFRLAGIL